jgi:hypothetical protein
MYETFLTFNHTSFRYNYLCHYLPIAAGMNTLSRSLMKFKRGAHPDLEAWIDSAREALAEKPPSGDSILLRALGHRELTAHNTSSPNPHSELTPQNIRPSSLDLPCRTLALDFGCLYLPTLLSKTRETLSNKNLSRPEREAQLLDVYSADIIDAPASYLIIDDILTTGATIHAIIAALRRKSSTCPIRVFTLARASNNPLPGPIIPLHGRSFRFDPGSGWVQS